MAFLTNLEKKEKHLLKNKDQQKNTSDDNCFGQERWHVQFEL